MHAGDLVDTSGAKLGEHTGTENFTIGQRRGHGIGGTDPLYVVALEPERGRVWLGTREECGVRSLKASDLNWIGIDVPASNELRVAVQHRYHCVPAPATVSVSGSSCEVVFDEPELSVTPGQGAAFYVGDRLIGGAWIDSTVRAEAPRAPATPRAESARS